MSNVQIRPILKCFCQILSVYGFSPMTPEMFRLAKFDRDEATLPLWRIIFELIHFYPDPNNQQSSQEVFDRTSKDQLVQMIKTDLYQRGYVYDHFRQLDGQMKHGSRALLVCLGWLIYHVKFFEQCLLSIFQFDEKSSESNKTSLEQIKQAIRSNRLLRNRLTNLQERLNEPGETPRTDSISSGDGDLLQHREYLVEYLNKLDHQDHQLNLLFFWYRNENTFWKWMESVLDQPSTSADDRPSRSTIDSQQLEAEREKFNAAIDTLDDALVRLEQLWVSNTDRPSIEKDMNSIVKSIDQQISSLFDQLLRK